MPRLSSFCAVEECKKERKSSLSWKFSNQKEKKVTKEFEEVITTCTDESAEAIQLQMLDEESAVPTIDLPSLQKTMRMLQV